MDNFFKKTISSIYRALHINENDSAINFRSVLSIAISASICTLPFFIHQTLFVSHDIKFHLFQSLQFYKSIASGTLLPRWALDANNGYGSPNFVFYSPLSYYVVSLFNSIIPSLIVSVIASIWLSLFLSGLTMFVTIRKFAGSINGLICAFVYQFIPFHVIDLYLRGTIAELFGFIWFPLIITYLIDLFEHKKIRSSFIGFSISYAGLILTHLVSAFIFGLIIAIYAFMNMYSIKKFIIVSLSSMLSIALAAYFIIPIFFEIPYVSINYIHSYPFSNYNNNFLLQLNNIISVLTMRSVQNNVIGLLDIVVLLELVLFCVLVYFVCKNKKYTHITENRLFTFSIYIFLLSFFMATPLSRWLWNLLPPLNTIQFPWRWVAFMDVALIFVFAVFLKEGKDGRHFSASTYRFVFYMIFALALISVFGVFVGNKKLSTNVINSILYPETFGYHTDLPREYTPIWSSDFGSLLTLPAPPHVTVLAGKASTQVVAWQPEKRVIKVEATSHVRLRIATSYYPGWIAESEGEREEIQIEKNSGAMLVDIEPGKHMLTLTFADTPVRRLAKIISVISCLTLCVYTMGTYIRNDRFQGI